MNNRAFVQSVWDGISDVLGMHGFALGGGLAMRAHGIVDRETQDIDAFRKDPLLSEPESFDQAELGITTILTERGFTVSKLYHQDFGRKYEVTDPTIGLTTTIDLGRDRFPGGFVQIEGYGTVVNRDDMAGMKMRALWERHAERDYVDYDAMRNSMIWDAKHLVELLERTGSIMPPDDESWNPRLARILASAVDDADEILLEDIGVDDVDALFSRLAKYARDHEQLAE